MYEVRITFPNGAIVRTWEATRVAAEAFARRIADGAIRFDISQASVCWTIRPIA